MNIGDEFWSDWQGDIASTDTNEHRVKYRVVEMYRVEIAGLLGEGRGETT